MNADCVILTALPKELDKVLFHFRHWKKIHGISDRVFYETKSANGLSLVAASAIGMGQVNAMALTQEIINLYKPKKIILVGIAGGLDKKIPLGDVVISDQIVDYELGKISQDGFTPRWSVYQADFALINKFKNYCNNKWVDYITTPRPSGYLNEKPQFHIGLYLSGNKIIADELTAGALKSFWTRGAAIEMEGAGIASLLRQIKNPPGFIIVKGLCDYADLNKNDEWQEYSADAAASLAFSFVLDELEHSDLMKSYNEEPEIQFKQIDFRALRITLSKTYNMKELKSLCFDLNINWDEIAGSTLSEKIIELLSYLDRRSSLDNLINIVNKDRDNILSTYNSQQY